MKTPYDAALRWRKDQLDTLRRALATLYAQEEHLKNELAMLEARVQNEQQQQNERDLLLFNHEAYLASMRAQRAQLLTDLDTLAGKIAEQQIKIAEQFQDVKALDIACTNYREALRAERDAKERATLDDQAAQRFLTTRDPV